MGGFLEKFDVFGEPLPSFNIKGSEEVTSKAGGFATLIIFIVMLLFGAMKFE